VSVNGIDYLDRGWKLDRFATCMIDGDTDERRSYDEVRTTTFTVANALRARGFGPGSHISLLSNNSILTFEVVLSVMRSEAVHLPVNARNTIADNAEIFRRFDCDLLFVQAEFESALPTIAEIAPNIRQFVCIDGTVAGAMSLEDFIAGYDATEFTGASDPERPWEILTTGGTTGFPKGVVWPHRQIESIVANFTAVAPPTSRPVFLAAAPLTHLAGKFMQFVLAHGGAGVVYSRVDRREILRAIPRHAITHVFLPPTVIYDLMMEPGVRDIDYSSLQYFVYSAAPMAPEKVRLAIDIFGPVMCQVWGQSESAWNTVLLPSDHLVNGEPAPLERLSSCGKPLPFVSCAVMGLDGNLLGDNEIGELVVRGSCVMSGYYQDSAATQQVSAYGWHHTGDVGRRDEYGFYYIVDRMKDMIISGGFNIYSVEVERALLDHPGVKECAVIGVPHAKWGEAVHAVVELAGESTVTGPELINWCRERTGAMKAPKSIDIVPALPRNTNGKVLKRELRRQHEQGSYGEVS
jgi:acyl-CoA synthetase (AMP-forming)/AMP-acid ligase II